MGDLSLEMALMAVERVRERLLRATAALEQAQVPYAVIGGHAVAVWVASVDPEAVRNTKDVDILLRRQDLHAATPCLANAGFDAAEVWGVQMFLDRQYPNPRSAVHVVFAGERVRPHDAHVTPSLSHTQRSPEGFAVVGLCELLMMKLQSFRDIDRTHVRDLIGVGLIDDVCVSRLPPDLCARLEQIRASPDG